MATCPINAERMAGAQTVTERSCPVSRQSGTNRVSRYAIRLESDPDQ
jgi:hypothetical protein